MIPKGPFPTKGALLKESRGGPVPRCSHELAVAEPLGCLRGGNNPYFSENMAMLIRQKVRVGAGPYEVSCLRHTLSPKLIEIKFNLSRLSLNNINVFERALPKMAWPDPKSTSYTPTLRRLTPLL